MLELLLKIIILLLSSSGVFSIWFYSPIKCSLAKLLFKIKDSYDPSDFDDCLALYSTKLAFLSSCHYCVIFWVSIFLSFFVVSSFSEMLLCVLSVNYIHYVLNKYGYGR